MLGTALVRLDSEVRPSQRHVDSTDAAARQLGVVEVLVLQPQVLMVVVITSTGGVTKRVLEAFRQRVLVEGTRI